MSLPSIKPVLFIGKKYTDGASPIMIRITSNRKSSYVKTGYSAFESNWNPKLNRLYEVKPRLDKEILERSTPAEIKALKKEIAAIEVLHNARKINADIDDKLSDLAGIRKRMEVNEEQISSTTLKSQLNQKYAKVVINDFFEFSVRQIEQLRQRNQVATYKRYNTVVDVLKETTGERLDFADITYEFLNNYKTRLIEYEYKTNSIHNHFKTIRAIYYKAVKEGLVSQDKNPFFIFKLEVDNNIRKEKLNQQELDKILKLKLKVDSGVWHCRNYFMFSMYAAGIRVSDLIQLKWENVSDGRVSYNMDKTGGYKSIKITPKIQEVLDLYKKPKAKSQDFIFPLLSEENDYSDQFFLKAQISSKTALYNKNLKELASLAKIKKKLTSHIARHTFTDLARTKGASMYDLKNALGHSSLKITENYLSKFDFDSVDTMMESVF